MTTHQKNYKSTARFTKRRSFRIDPELEDRFKKAAIKDGRNFDGALRLAIHLFIMYVNTRRPDKDKLREILDNAAEQN